MSSFKDDVLYYLGKNPSDETPFDLFEGEEKEDEKEDICPDCGKKSCECECGKDDKDDKDDEEKASKSTETAGGDDGDDGYHYSVATGKPAVDFGATPEEIEMIKLIKKNNGLGKKFVPETPEEKEMLVLMNKILAKKSAVKTALPGDFNKVTQNKGASEDSPDLKDDHTNGRNGSCQTESKNIFNY
jgi:hypothetical protein